MQAVTKEDSPYSVEHEESEVLVNEPDHFDLQYQFDLYLQRVQLKGKKLPMKEYHQIKMAFYGSVGQMLVVLGSKLSADPEEQQKQVDTLMSQVDAYFKTLNKQR